MKKYLSLLLCLAILACMFGFAACERETAPPANDVEAGVGNEGQPEGGQDQVPEGGQQAQTTMTGVGVEVAVTEAEDGSLLYNGQSVAALEAAAPCEYIVEKLAAGLEPLIASSFVSLKSDFMVTMNEGMESAFTEAGFSYASATSEETINIQLEHIENYVTMGASILCIYPNDADMVGNAAVDAMAEGCYVVVNGRVDPSYGVTLVSQQDHALLGQAMGDMVLNWVDVQYGEDYDGLVKGAVFYNLNIPDFRLRYENFMPMLEADPRVEIVYENHGPVMGADAAFTATEEALTYDPEICFVICTTSSGALGVSNYIVSQTFDDPLDYAAFGTDSTEMALDMVDEALAGGNSVLRGVVFTGTFNPADSMTEPVFRLLRGELEPGSVYLDPITTYNSFGFTIE